MRADNPQHIFLEMAIHFGNVVCQGYYTKHLYKEFNDCSIYDGSSGIAIFLIELYRQTKNYHFKDEALRIFDNAWSLKNKATKEPYTLLGFWSGWTGLAFASILIGRIIHNDHYISKGLSLIDQLSERNIYAYSVDTTNGAAGAIPALIKVYKHYPSQSLLEFINSLGEEIIRKAEHSAQGWSWQTMPARSTLNNLTGHSHGSAGIVTSLFELFNFTKQSKYINAAYNGLKYERDYFNAEQQNWPDFRLDHDSKSVDEINYTSYWCHGAAGIVLSRIRCYELSLDPTILAEANIGINTMLPRSSFANKNNASLCHGVFGNSMILLYAGHILKDQSLVNYAIANGHGGITKYHLSNRPWTNGIHNQKPVPGLMLGFSGLGYAYLRLWNPKDVPMIMLIDPDSRF